MVGGVYGWTCSRVSGLVCRESEIFFCLVLDMFLIVWSCILHISSVWTCIVGDWTCLGALGLVVGCLDLYFGVCIDVLDLFLCLDLDL